MVITYLSLLVLFVLPMGLSWYLQGMSQEQSFSPERLASLEITSPYSAAFSVPMHVNRIESWTNAPLNVQPTVLVHLWDGVGLPVWTIFLIIYPPLSLLFLGITYLAFRWRWWKAGDSS
jgi:hypothetical protein